MIIFFNLIAIFVVGIIFNYLFLFGLYLGLGGSDLKHKIHNNDFSWLNKVLILFIGVYLVMLFLSNTIYLDSDKVDVVLGMENVAVTVSGPLIQQLVENFGAVSAFAAGSKVGCTIFAKTNLHPLSKAGGSIMAGAMSVVTWKILEVQGKSYQSIYSVKQTGENSLHINIGEIKVFGGDKVNLKNDVIKNKFTEFFEKIVGQMNVTSKSFSSEKMNLESVEKIRLISKNKLKIEDLVDTSLFHAPTPFASRPQLTSLDEELVVKKSDIIINSPLEDVYAITNEGHNHLVLLTNYSLILNLMVAYFIALSLFIFTVRYVINSDSLVKKINNNGSIPNLLKMFLTKSINTWTYTSNFWIYFFLIAAFFGSLVSASGMHTCLYIISNFTPFSCSAP